MPVYNCEQFVTQAIESILSQTFADFELIIIDDGSTDKSLTAIRAINDARIIVVSHTHNKGLVARLNEGINISRGQYIARMDQDDWAFSERLAKQVVFLDTHPEYGLCGTHVVYVGDHAGSKPVMGVTDDELRCNFMFNNAFAHATVMIRKSVLDEFSLRYDQSYYAAEDYKLWLDIAERAKIYNVPEVLLKYRQHDGQMCRVFTHEQVVHLKNMYRNHISKLIPDVTDSEIDVHCYISSLLFEPQMEWLSSARLWLQRLLTANRERKLFVESIFRKTVTEKWFYACLRKRAIIRWVCMTFLCRSDFDRIYSLRLFVCYVAQKIRELVCR